jgi:hypothetical protein
VAIDPLLHRDRWLMPRPVHQPGESGLGIG